MTVVGLRELRQNVSEIVRRAEEGEEIVVMVAGRPAVKLVPARLDVWRRFEDFADLFEGPPDPHWDEDRDLVDQALGLRDDVG